jgi:hypothetical protein
MSRFKNIMKYGMIGATFAGTPALVFVSMAHLVDPVRASRHNPGQMDDGPAPWSLVGIVAAAGFAVGAIYGACKPVYHLRPEFMAGLLANPAFHIDIDPARLALPASVQIQPFAFTGSAISASTIYDVSEPANAVQSKLVTELLANQDLHAIEQAQPVIQPRSPLALLGLHGSRAQLATSTVASAPVQQNEALNTPTLGK